MQLTRLGAVADAHLVGAGLRKRNIAQHQRRLVLAILALDEGGGLAENLGGVLAVQRDRDFGRIDQGGELDFEVEAGAGQNIGAVDGIDGLRRTGRRRDCNRNTGRRCKEPAHVVILHCLDDQAYSAYMTAW